MKRCLAAVSSIVFLSCVSPVLADQDTPWIMKASGDMFSIDSSVDGYFGIGGDNTGATTFNGDLTGGTLTLGKVFKTSTPTVLLFDLGARSGDLEGEFTHINGGKVDFDIERDDVEAAFTYQWLGKRWQPYVSLGYWGLEYTAIPVDQFGIDFYDIFVDTDSFYAGLGLGVKIGQIDMGTNGSLQFSAKVGTDLLFVSAAVDTTENNGTIHHPVDDETIDYRWKVTGLMNYLLPVKTKPTSIFLEGGYQNQAMEFESTNDQQFQLEWDGYYARLGLSVQL